MEGAGIFTTVLIQSAMARIPLLILLREFTLPLNSGSLSWPDFRFRIQ